MRLLLFGAALALAAPTATQTNPTGLTVQTAGAVIGGICQPFSCTPDQGGLSSNSRALVSVWGTPNSPFWLSFGVHGGACRPFPKIMNNLLLTRIQGSLGSGLTGTASPLNTCGLGEGQIGIVVPPSIPAGTTFTLQALVVPVRTPNAAGAAFTNGVTLTIR